jgi:hypothetical protein
MTWKRRTPAANRRRRSRLERWQRSYAAWVVVERRFWAELGLHGAELRAAARLSARYIVSGQSLGRVIELSQQAPAVRSEAAKLSASSS